MNSGEAPSVLGTGDVRGELVAPPGRPGSGKTTLLTIIGGPLAGVEGG